VLHAQCCGQRTGALTTNSVLFPNGQHFYNSSQMYLPFILVFWLEIDVRCALDLRRLAKYQPSCDSELMKLIFILRNMNIRDLSKLSYRIVSCKFRTLACAILPLTGKSLKVHTPQNM
jgi:hypothetical protein